MQLLSRKQGEIELTPNIPSYLESALIPSAVQRTGLGQSGDYMFQDLAFTGGRLRVSHLVARGDETIFILDDHGGVFFQLILLDTLNCRMNGLGQLIIHEWGYNSFCTSSIFKEIILRKGHTYKMLEVKLHPDYWESVLSTYPFADDFRERARQKITGRLSKVHQIANPRMMAAAEKILQGSQYPLLDTITEMLSLSFDRQMKSPIKKAHKLSQEEIDRVYQIKKYLFENISRRYTLPDLAAKQNIDPYHLRKWFKAVYGMTAIELAHFERMRQASILMRLGQKKAWEIAVMLGYQSESALSRAFKKYYRESLI
jgi:AraC-like DNA-binding protein